MNSLIDISWATAPRSSSSSLGGSFLGGSTNSSIITTSLWYFGDLSFSPTLFFPSPTSQAAGIVTYNTNGNPLWITRFDSVGDDNNIQTAINNTHVFSIGSFQANTFNISGIIINGNSTYTSAFITAHTTTGSLVTAKSITATSSIRGYSIKVHNNIIYIAGLYNSALTIDSKSITAPTGQGSFIAAFSFDTSFNCIWLNKIDSTGQDITTNLSITNNKLFAGGSFIGLLAIDGFTISSSTQSSYIASYNLSGQVQLLLKIDSSGTDNLFGLDTANNKIYAAGTYTGSFSLGSFTLPSPSSTAVYIASFDTSLNLIWLKGIDSAGTESVGFNILAANSNFCFVNITYTTTITVGPYSFNSPSGSKGTLTVCYDRYGNVVGAIPIDSTGSDDSNTLFATDTTLYSTVAYGNTLNISGTLLPTPLPTPPSGRQLPLLISYSIKQPLSQSPTLTFNSNTASINLSWTSIPDSTDYRIYYGLSGSGFTSYTPNISGLLYTISSLIPGSIYQFTVVALNYGNESPYSNIVYATPLSSTPSIFNIISNIKQVDLSWSTVSGATGYRVYYGLNGSDFSLYQDFITVSNGSITGLAAGLEYKFYIVSYNNGGESIPPSTILTSIPLSPIPTQLNVTPVNLGTNLTWNLSEGVIAYKIYYGLSGTYNLSGVFTGLSGNITNLTPDVFYNFKISSINNGGESPLSSPVYTMPLPLPPSIPNNFTLRSSILQIDLSWNKVSGATGYKISYGLYNIFDNEVLLGDISSYTFTTLLPDLSYGFILQVLNNGGISPPTSPIYGVCDPPIPDVPIDFCGNQAVKSSKLYWTNTAYSYNYVINYSLSSSLTDISTIIISGSESNFITGLCGESTYKFSIAARNRTGQSAFTPYIYITPWIFQPISKPVWQQITPLRTQILLKFNNIYNANYYKIYYGINNIFTNEEFVTSKQLNDNNSTVNILYLISNTTYNFKIIAYNDETFSPESDIIYITTLAPEIIKEADASIITMKNDNNTIYQANQINQRYRINKFKFQSASDRLKYINGFVNDSFVTK
jgi:hypothetical protein